MIKVSTIISTGSEIATNAKEVKAARSALSNSLTCVVKYFNQTNIIDYLIFIPIV